uniref:WD_REPEATS_REGION domain-containing protein n=1 Tax=Rhabditophanes sp. KR3021 TaxID=114890 RepID=A0AC35TN03_9BILA
MVSLKKVQTITHSNDSKSLRVWCAIWNYDGTHLVTCGEDKCIRIWEFDKNSIKEKPILYQSIENEQNRAIRCLAFNYNYDNPRLAAASFDGSVNIYKGNRVEKYIETNKLEGHENEVKCCAYSPNGDYLATCSRDRSTWVWESGKLIKTTKIIGKIKTTKH